jgi:hypothetical protein
MMRVSDQSVGGAQSGDLIMTRPVFALLAAAGLTALESLPYLPPTKSSSCASVMFEMRNLFLSLTGTFAGILRSASAHIAEHSCQLLAPVVEISVLSNVAAVRGIGIRLARDGCTMPNNDNVPARLPRLDQLHGTLAQAAHSSLRLIP